MQKVINPLPIFTVLKPQCILEKSNNFSPISLYHTENCMSGPCYTTLHAKIRLLYMVAGCMVYRKVV